MAAPVQIRVSGGLIETAVTGAIPNSAPQVTVTATTTQVVSSLATNQVLAKTGVTLQAPSSNTHSVFVGGADIAPNAGSPVMGLELTPGASVTYPVDDPRNLYVACLTGQTGQLLNVQWT